MKRIILIFAAILLLLPAAEAQYSQGVLTETTTVTRTKIEKPKKERQKFDAKRGYQQEVSIGWWWTHASNNPDYSSLRASYIGGIRFNNYFYAGIGAGLDIGTANCDQDSAYKYSRDDDWELNDTWYNEGDYGSLPMQLIAVPIFVNFKVYFTRNKVVPYFSFSTGARLSTSKQLKFYESYNYQDHLTQTIKYGAIKPFFDLSVGISYRHSNNMAFVLQCGCYLHNVTQFNNDFDSLIVNLWENGLSLSIGMTF